MDTENSLRYLLGFIFLFFGVLKLAGERTVSQLVAETMFVIPVEIFLPILALWEVCIGICFIHRPLNRIGLYLLIPHITGTFLPIFVSPETVFTSSGLTLEGHYIVKNLLLLAVAFHIQDKPESMFRDFKTQLARFYTI
ncbi:MAG: putative membrane protein YkgB [Candidatus Nanohaloarchaea archaeon]|jgi:uncharacterized membrane protein YkgB